MSGSRAWRSCFLEQLTVRWFFVLVQRPLRRPKGSRGSASWSSKSRRGDWLSFGEKRSSSNPWASPANWRGRDSYETLAARLWHAVFAVARAIKAAAPRVAWRAAVSALVSPNRSGRRTEAMRAAGSSDPRTSSIDRAATSARRACAAVAGAAASSAIAALKLLSHQCGTRRAVRTARDWLYRRVVIERWRCLVCLLSAVLGDCYSSYLARQLCRNCVRPR